MIADVLAASSHVHVLRDPTRGGLAATLDAVVAAMRRHPEGADALIIGRVVDDHLGTVISKTALGSNRIIDTHVGDQFPRIC